MVLAIPVLAVPAVLCAQEHSWTPLVVLAPRARVPPQRRRRPVMVAPGGEVAVERGHTRPV